MTSQDWIARGDQHIARTYARYPLVAVKGEGCRLWDADGKCYLDFLAGVAVNNLGHCHPKVVAALQEQAAPCCTAPTTFTSPVRSNWPNCSASIPSATGCSSATAAPRPMRRP
jgi:acetylornithine/N-succinyldiaminopimelate aminotransferase